MGVSRRLRNPPSMALARGLRATRPKTTPEKKKRKGGEKAKKKEEARVGMWGDNTKKGGWGKGVKVGRDTM